MNIFGEPDMATTRLQELTLCSQDNIETIMQFMIRLRLLVMKAHPTFSHKDKYRVLVLYFLLGLRDRLLAVPISVTAIPTLP